MPRPGRNFSPKGSRPRPPTQMRGTLPPRMKDTPRATAPCSPIWHGFGHFRCQKSENSHQKNSKPSLEEGIRCQKSENSHQKNSKPSLEEGISPPSARSGRKRKKKTYKSFFVKKRNLRMRTTQMRLHQNSYNRSRGNPEICYFFARNRRTTSGRRQNHPSARSFFGDRIYSFLRGGPALPGRRFHQKGRRFQPAVWDSSKTALLDRSQTAVWGRSQTALWDSCQAAVWDSSQTAIWDSSQTALWTTPRQPCGQLPDSSLDNSQTALWTAPRQLSGKLADSCLESSRTAVWKTPRQLSGQLPDSCLEIEGFPLGIEGFPDSLLKSRDSLLESRDSLLKSRDSLLKSRDSPRF